MVLFSCEICMAGFLVKNLIWISSIDFLQKTIFANINIYLKTK